MRNESDQNVDHLELEMVADRMLVEPDVTAPKTSSGIIIPLESRNNPTYVGQVIDVGPLVEVVKPGDYILYGRQNVNKLEGKIIIRESDAMMVF